MHHVNSSRVPEERPQPRTRVLVANGGPIGVPRTFALLPVYLAAVATLSQQSGPSTHLFVQQHRSLP